MAGSFETSPLFSSELVGEVRGHVGITFDPAEIAEIESRRTTSGNFQQESREDDVTQMT